VNNKTIIVIAGPTAVGKTAIAIELAQHFATEIISADSRQCYRELNIGVAKPSKEELQIVPHYFINSHSFFDTVNAVTYQQYALQILEQLFVKHNIVVVCGGTGLYIKALSEGIDTMPNVPAEITQQVQAEYEKYGLEWLQQQVQQKDATFWQQAEKQNPHRLLRALAFFTAHNTSIIHYQTKQKVQRNFNSITIGVNTERANLYAAINKRVEVMMQNGLLEEVTQLKHLSKLKALQTVGYTELFSYLQNEISLPQAVALIQQNTRQYAKRQLTWFNKVEGLQWFNQSPTIVKDIVAYINEISATLNANH
jgi:tRNA dimethylallyltransferase